MHSRHLLLHHGFLHARCKVEYASSCDNGPDKQKQSKMLEHAKRFSRLSDRFADPDRTTCSCRLPLLKTIRRRLFGRRWLAAAGLCGVHQVSCTPMCHKPTKSNVLEDSTVNLEHCVTVTCAWGRSRKYPVKRSYPAMI